MISKQKTIKHSPVFYNSQFSNNGFTIVELLVVIVIIGILATVTIVSYVGISQRANGASLAAELAGIAKQAELYKVENDEYPGSIGPCVSLGDNELCIEEDPNKDYIYNAGSAGFTISITSDNVTYRVKNGMTPYAFVPCPTGFIEVPGNGTYGTNDFCVMKYEASNVGGVAKSNFDASPWTAITQSDAVTASTTACSGCHLITEAEWMTIAYDVLSVPSNWSSGVVGSGYIYSGHNDYDPTWMQTASSDDNNGYYGTGNVTPSNQRRTLTLSNGEVIWDLAGNACEWTSGITTNQPGVVGQGYYDWRQWTSIDQPGDFLPSISPASTGIAGSEDWDSSYGMGQIWSNGAASPGNAILRGGGLSYDNRAGVLAAMLHLNTTSNYDGWFGFRVAR